jgi:hypothetical protein
MSQRMFLYWYPVNKGAVVAIEVYNREFIALLLDQAMPPGH